MAADNSHLNEEFIDSVIAGRRSADVSGLAFRGPSQFVAGGLHTHPQAWSKVASFLPADKSTEVIDWVNNKVDVSKYFVNFTGGFKGEWFDSDTPPSSIFRNHPSCIPFAQFISPTILQEILRFPQDDGLLFNHVWGKTLRDGSSNLFGVRRHQNPSLCPVRSIDTYMAVCAELGLDLSHGFLFRPTTPRGSIQNKQVSSSTMQARLQLHLKEASIYEGETLHTFSAGAAITLALSGAQLGEIMSHVGCRNPSTASCYLKLANVL